MDNWSSIFMVVALLFSIICFGLFLFHATRPTLPDTVVDNAAKRAEAHALNPAAIGALVKALAEAFSKVGPAALALIGAILFFLLAGEAGGVFHLSDAPEKKAETNTRSGGSKTGADGNQTIPAK